LKIQARANPTIASVVNVATISIKRS
jgi:hypothetical protein